MRARAVVAVAAIVVMAAVCARLGFWQLSRLAEKRAENARRAEALAAAPRDAGSELLASAEPPAAQLRVRGRFDETRQVLLSARAHEGSPGVHVVTPLLFEDGAGAVLVNRGWLYAGDAATARPDQHPEPGPQTVTGIAATMSRGVPGSPWRVLRRDSVTLWSARRLDVDSIAARFPYRVAPVVVTQLPGDGVPAMPARVAPRPLDDAMHLSYAVQWFLFGTILVAGSILVAARSRRGAKPAPRPGDM
jgi:surfeit locus 1 family protein